MTGLEPKLLKAVADNATARDQLLSAASTIMREGDTLIAYAPPTLSGLIEVRGAGIIAVPAIVAMMCCAPWASVVLFHIDMVIIGKG